MHLSLQPVDTAAIKALATSPAGLSLLSDAARAEQAVQDWLADLVRLKGVPFNQLVPLPAMLPPESLQVFTLDQAWIDCLLDGALSIAIASTRDRTLQDQVIVTLRNGARDAAGAAAGTTISGFLLNSSLVTSQPGLIVNGYSTRNPTPQTQPLPVLRLDHPAPQILFGLFAGAVVTLEIGQPQAGLQFGFEEIGLPAVPTVQMRTLTGHNPGSTMSGQASSAAPYIDPLSRVVNVSGLAGHLKETLQTNGGLAHDGPWGPGAFAVQVVLAPETKPFAVAPAG